MGRGFDTKWGCDVGMGSHLSMLIDRLVLAVHKDVPVASACCMYRHLLCHQDHCAML
jgi:hypothetical protein